MSEGIREERMCGVILPRRPEETEKDLRTLLVRMAELADTRQIHINCDVEIVLDIDQDLERSGLCVDRAMLNN